MKKRLKKKLSKEILGVKKLVLTKDDVLLIEVENLSISDQKEILNNLSKYLGCKVVVVPDGFNISVVNIVN